MAEKKKKDDLLKDLNLGLEEEKFAKEKPLPFELHPLHSMPIHREHAVDDMGDGDEVPEQRFDDEQQEVEGGNGEERTADIREPRAYSEPVQEDEVPESTYDEEREREAEEGDAKRGYDAGAEQREPYHQEVPEELSKMSGRELAKWIVSQYAKWVPEITFDLTKINLESVERHTAAGRFPEAFMHTCRQINKIYWEELKLPPEDQEYLMQPLEVALKLTGYEMDPWAAVFVNFAMVTIFRYIRMGMKKKNAHDQLLAEALGIVREHAKKGKSASPPPPKTEDVSHEEVQEEEDDPDFETNRKKKADKDKIDEINKREK